MRIIETLVTSKVGGDEGSSIARRLWPVDKLLLFYLGITGLLIAVYSRRIPGATWLLLGHAAGALLIIVIAKKFVSPLSLLFRHWYPALVVPALYKEMSVLIPALRATAMDETLARLDYAIWGVNPTVWLERIQHPLLTEYLQFIYSMFMPAFILVGALYWLKRPLAEFRYYGFLVVLGFLVSYIGYFLVPARGPRFILAHLHSTELQGLWTYQWFRDTLDSLEGVHYDCFPSGHTQMTILAWWSCRQLSRTAFYAFGFFTLCQIFSTVYLRYHYSVDLMAGFVFAVVLLLVTPGLYAALERGAGRNIPARP